MLSDFDLLGSQWSLVMDRADLKAFQLVGEEHLIAYLHIWGLLGFDDVITDMGKTLLLDADFDGIEKCRGDVLWGCAIIPGPQVALESFLQNLAQSLTPTAALPRP